MVRIPTSKKSMYFSDFIKAFTNLTYTYWLCPPLSIAMARSEQMSTQAAFQRHDQCSPPSQGITKNGLSEIKQSKVKNPQVWAENLRGCSRLCTDDGREGRRRTTVVGVCNPLFPSWLLQIMVNVIGTAVMI